MPGRDDCTALAATLLVGLMKQHGQVPSNPGAYRIFQDLLHAAGYTLTDDTDEQPCWARLSRDGTGPDKKLRIGWFPWGKFAYSKREVAAADDPDDFQGPARIICQRMCELLGVQIEPVRLTVSELPEKIQNREIDVLAPFVQLPARMFDVACSKPLTSVHPSRRLMSVGINIVVQVAFKERLIEPTPRRAQSNRKETQPGAARGHASSDAWFDRLDQVPFSALLCYWANGGIPDVILPAASDIPHRERESSLVAAWDKTRADLGKTLVPAFVADEISCFHREVTNPGYQRILRFPAYRLPVTFGVHPSETRLLTTLNACLEILEHDRFLSDQLAPSVLGNVFPDEPQ